MTEEPFYGVERLASATVRGREALKDPDSEFWNDNNPWEEAREMLEHSWAGKTLLQRIEEEHGSAVASELESLYRCMEKVSETVQPLGQSYEDSPVMEKADFLADFAAYLEQNYGMFTRGTYARP